jgi:hypothetical protein
MLIPNFDANNANATNVLDFVMKHLEGATKFLEDPQPIYTREWFDRMYDAIQTTFGVENPKKLFEDAMAQFETANGKALIETQMGTNTNELLKEQLALAINSTSITHLYEAAIGRERANIVYGKMGEAAFSSPEELSARTENLSPAEQSLVQQIMTAHRENMAEGKYKNDLSEKPTSLISSSIKAFGEAKSYQERMAKRVEAAAKTDGTRSI